MYKEIFPKRIKEARDDTGLKQAKVAELTGISRSNISKYENGELEPTLESLGTLAEFYNVKVDWLLGIGRKTDTEEHNKRINEIKQQNIIITDLEKDAKKQLKMKID